MIIGRLVRVSAFSVMLILVCAVSLRTPARFLPEGDQGAFFMTLQALDGASVTRTGEMVRRIETLRRLMPQFENVFAITGYSFLDGASEPNAALIVPTLNHAPTASAWPIPRKR
jgi:hydrophobic/amphiphilic exporter-1 (mainly G- bacteria), HAE1 family